MHCFRVPALILLLLLSSSAGAVESVDTLTRYLPLSANGLVVVRVQDVLASPRGVREKWSENAAQFLAGSATIPHWIDLFVMATQAGPGHDDGWSATVIPLPESISLASIAKRQNIATQLLGGVSAAYTRNSYYLELAPQVLGVMTPAQRQNAARWARQAQSATASPLTPFLKQSALLPDQIVMAMDMQDMLDPHVVDARLQASPSLAGKAETIAALKEAIVGLQGAAFRANVKDATMAQVVFEFSASPPPYPAEMKAVFLEVLSDEQIMIEEFKTATAKIAGNALLLDTNLSDASLRKVMSLVLSPYPTAPSAPIAPSTQPTPPTTPVQPKEDEAQAKLRLSRSYYAQINRALGDMQRAAENTVVGNYQYVDQAGWIERASKRISNLSIQGVDPDLVKYGADVTSKLNALSSSLRGMVVNVNAAQSTLTYQVQASPVAIGGGWGGGWGGYGRGWGGAVVPYYNWQSNLEEVRKQQAQAVAGSSADRDKIWQSVLSERESIRQLMLQRYNEDFDKALF